MGLRGTKPLPANVHILRGNGSKLPASRLIDTVCPPAEIPSAPDHLNEEGLREWGRISQELLKLGLITQIDRAALAVYCQAYGRWVQAERKIANLGDAGLEAETPSGYKQIGVWLQISNRAVEQMHKMMAEFGMTPSARSRVTPSAPQQGDLFNGTTGNPADKYF